jgi:hypothetical protein
VHTLGIKWLLVYNIIFRRIASKNFRIAGFFVLVALTQPRFAYWVMGASRTITSSSISLSSVPCFQLGLVHAAPRSLYPLSSLAAASKGFSDLTDLPLKPRLSCRMHEPHEVPLCNVRYTWCWYGSVVGG